jgi:hypothetical protein
LLLILGNKAGNDGGVMLVEPWFTPDAWQRGVPHMITLDEDRFKVCRMNVSEAKDERLSFFRFHYLLGTPQGVEYFTEDHTLGLFTVTEMKAAFGYVRTTQEPQTTIASFDRAKKAEKHVIAFAKVEVDHVANVVLAAGVFTAGNLNELRVQIDAIHLVLVAEKFGVFSRATSNIENRLGIRAKVLDPNLDFLGLFGIVFQLRVDLVVKIRALREHIALP